MAQSVIGNLVVQMSANSAALTESFNRAKRSTRQFGKQARDSNKMASDSFFSLSNAIQVAAGFLGLRQFAQSIDVMRNLNSQLRLVTESSRDLAITQRELFQLSQDTFQSVGTVTNLYARLVRTTGDLNLSQADLLKITRTVTNAFRISGATQQEASNAIIQLSQGLAAGALRGEEFNSVAEQAPRLMQVFAEHLGKNVGELRAMAKEGQITADVITGALLGGFDKIQHEADRLAPTISAAFIRVSNSALRLVGTFDRVTDSGIERFVASFAKVLDFLADDVIVRVQAGFQRLFADIDEGSANFRRIMAGAGEFFRNAWVQSIEVVIRAWLRFRGLFSDTATQVEESLRRSSEASERYRTEIERLNAEIEKQKRDTIVIKAGIDAWRDYEIRLDSALVTQAKLNTETTRFAGALKGAKGAMDAFAAGEKAGGGAGKSGSALQDASTPNAFVRRDVLRDSRGNRLAGRKLEEAQSRGLQGRALGVGFELGGKRVEFGERAPGGKDVAGSLATLARHAASLTSIQNRTAGEDLLLGRITEAIQLSLKTDEEGRQKKRQATFEESAAGFFERLAERLEGGTGKESPAPVFSSMEAVLMKIERNTADATARAG